MHSIAPAQTRQFSLQQLTAWALPAIFIMFGLVTASWASRIPDIRTALQIPHAGLSMVLLCGGIGAVVSFPVSSWLTARLGARRSVLLAGMAMVAALIGIGLAPNVRWLMAAVFLMGIPSGCMNVAMNAVATNEEKQKGKSRMAMLHAGCCAGALAGALLGGLMASMEIAPVSHFIAAGVAMAALLWLACHLLRGEVAEAPRAAADIAGKKKMFALPRGPLALLGALVFLSAMSEGSIADWSGVFLKDHFGVGDGVAPLAYAAYLGAMLCARMAGDRLRQLHGARRLVSGGAAVTAIGLLFAVVVPSPYLAMAGFAAAGLGLALVFPFVFSAAGAQGPVALAGVATMAYSGSLIGPPVIGSLAEGLGMQAAIGFVGLLAATLALVARRARLLE